MSEASSARRLQAVAVLVGLALLGLEAGRTREAWREFRQRSTLVQPPDISFKNGYGDIDRIGENAKPFGLKVGDRILSIDGRQFSGESSLRRAARQQSPGDSVMVRVHRSGQPDFDLKIPLKGRDGQVPWSDLLLPLFIEVFSHWLCLLLGFVVVLIRPRDPLAWLLLLMMASFARLASTLPSHYGDRWPLAIQAFAIAIDTFLNVTWTASMLLFGIYFPDPHSRTRIAAWTRWAVALPLFVLAVLFSFVNVAGSSFRLDLSPIVPLLRALNIPAIGLSFVAVAVFFANIPYKAARETNPDSRRRLRLFFWGANATLTPLLVLIVLSRVSGSLDRVPFWMTAILLILMSMFPAVVTYVIVVERALDLRVVVRQGLQYALASQGLHVVQILLTGAIIFLVADLATGAEVRRVERLRNIALAVIAVVLVTRFARGLQRWLDRRFFRDQAEAERLLLEVSQQVRGVIEPERLRSLVSETVSQALHVECVELKLNGAGDAVRNAELKLPLESGSRRLGWLILGPRRSEEPYSRSDIRLLETVAAQTALALDNARLVSAVAEEAAHRERIQREIEIAREVQERIFPQRKPAVDGLDYSGLYRPAESVGGDCFEYMMDEAGRLWLAIGDVAGKGIPAAMLMAGVNAALRGLLSAGVSEVGSVINHLNRVLYESTPKNRFVTLLLVRYEPSGRLVYASAGHCPMLVLRASGEQEWLTTRGVGLGLTGRSQYQQAETTLSAGDAFLLYTDGVTEARNVAGEEFGEARLALSCEGDSAHGLAASVLRALESFSAGAPQHDDITLLAAKRIAFAG